MNDLQRKRIEQSCTTKTAALEMAINILHEMELSHQRGMKWMPINDCNAHAITVLKKAGMIKTVVLDSNDCIGQIKGVRV